MWQQQTSLPHPIFMDIILEFWTPCWVCLDTKRSKASVSWISHLNWKRERARGEGKRGREMCLQIRSSWRRSLLEHWGRNNSVCQVLGRSVSDYYTTLLQRKRVDENNPNKNILTDFIFHKDFEVYFRRIQFFLDIIFKYAHFPSIIQTNQEFRHLTYEFVF